MQTIKLNFEGKSYTLEYTRKSVEIMSRQGFKLNDIADAPILAIPMLFQGAFIENHKNLRKSDTDRIFEAQNHKGELINALCEMYRAPLEALLEDYDEGAEDGNEKNVTWTVLGK
jgi:hypothetical protein